MRLTLPHPALDARTRLLTLLLPALLLLLRLGGAPLYDVDEGAFSEATREMFERGDFLSTWLNGEPRFDKPILIYWLQALAYMLLGPSEWAFRLPSALAATLWCHAVAVFAAPRLGRNAALLACAAATTSFGVFVIGRAATADALLNLLLALTLFDCWRHLESGARAPLLRAYFWMALGLLTKGPVAVLVPVATTLLYSASSGRLRDWLRACASPLGWLILLTVALPWYVAEYLARGQAFIDGFFLRHNVERFSGSLEGHGGSPAYYLLALPLLLLPWLAPLVAALRGAPGALRLPLPRFLWVWSAFVIVFFSLSGTKLPHYALYGCTPLFLLLGVAAERLRVRLTALLPVLLMFGLWLALPQLIALTLQQGWVADGYYRLQLERYAQALPAGYYALLGAGMLLSLISLVLRLQAGALLALAAGLHTLVLALAVSPFVGELLQGPVKRAGEFARSRPEAGRQWRAHLPSFSVYRRQVTPKGEPAPGMLAVTRADRLRADDPVELLFREGGVAVVKRREAQQ